MSSPYATARDLLADAAPIDVVAMPDGSVDTYRRVRDHRGDRVRARSTFGKRVAAGTTGSFRLAFRERAPGGHAVNAALQADALGDEPTLFGHLDHPVLADLPFETHSMGDPALVDVLTFEDGDLLLVDDPGTRPSWGVDDLRAAAPDALGVVARADVVVLTNWAGVRATDDLVDALADADLRGTVVFDPGDVTGADPDRLAATGERLRRLAATCPLVVSVNAGELGALSAALDAADRGDDVAAVRAALDADAAVLHHESRAVAAADERHVVANLSTDRAVRHTGAGDRFDAGLAHGLGAGWPWPPTLALANACAAHYVEHGETGDRETLRAYLRRKRPA